MCPQPVPSAARETLRFLVAETFRLTERLHLSAGANSYNVLNHPNLANPVNDISGESLARSNRG